MVEGELAGGEPGDRHPLGRGGVRAGDGLETDRLTLRWGQRIRLDVTPGRLALVEP
ncbi:hypothetical protein [Micromonospora sp. HUAS LYJ1]|uniref:hypothetical protein n=1 Tax=Micromonospora sp. HUAS LYJ1 TaxID=3061626 RepID=UPI0026729E0D|nr:hypothetical protein [Micromonospora sp. HUAS LYJ1]WKU03112.1 hypothetical protein Q2K16_19765 [Micromonospora sp. HUAS LYJ1]